MTTIWSTIILNIEEVKILNRIILYGVLLFKQTCGCNYKKLYMWCIRIFAKINNNNFCYYGVNIIQLLLLSFII